MLELGKCPKCGDELVFCISCDGYFCGKCKTLFDEIDGKLIERSRNHD
jgi:ribosomal protein S27AE